MRAKPIKVLSVFGTRPEAIKIAPVVIQLAGRPEFISKVAVTAQHREMLDQVIAHFGIPTDYDLNIMQDNQSLADISCRVLERLTPVLRQERPDMVLVHGDTTTTAISALAAYYEKIPCGHVEAGLRTGDKYAPFPEEINRKIAGIVCDIHFAPTEGAKANLVKEGIPEQSIFVTGNTVIDALLMTVEKNYAFRDKTLAALFGTGRICYNSECSCGVRYIVVEVHRRENFGEGLDNICRALATVARERSKDVKLLVSVHKNPNAREPVLKHLSGIDNVILFDPLSYPDYVNLLSRAYLVVSDSGGVQEEAPAVGVPVVLCREKTERPEAVEAGTVVLVGTNRDLIVETIYDLLDNELRYRKMATARNPFGDGRAAQRIVQALLYWFGLSEERPEEFQSLR